METLPSSCLMILQDSDQRAADRDTRTIECMHKSGLARFPGPAARSHPPRLEVGAVRQTRDFPPLLLPRQPHFEVPCQAG